MTLLAISGCSNDGSDKRDNEIRNEFLERYKIVMCAPWGIERERAISEFSDFIRFKNSGGSLNDILDHQLYGEIDEQDCLEAGYIVSGPLPISIEHLARRCQFPDISPPDSFSPEQAAKYADMTKARRKRCNQLEPLLAEAGYELDLFDTDDLKQDIHRCKLADVEPPPWMNEREATVMMARTRAWRAHCNALTQVDLSLPRPRRRLRQ